MIIEILIGLCLIIAICYLGGILAALLYLAWQFVMIPFRILGWLLVHPKALLWTIGSIIVASLIFG